VSGYGRWGPPKPLSEVWKIPQGSHADHAAEQDFAAGGRKARKVRLPNGRSATASIALKKLPKSRRVYAYMRYSLDRRTITRYVGEATEPTRLKALKRAWKLAHSKGLLDES